MSRTCFATSSLEVSPGVNTHIGVHLASTADNGPHIIRKSSVTPKASFNVTLYRFLFPSTIHDPAFNPPVFFSCSLFTSITSHGFSCSLQALEFEAQNCAVSSNDFLSTCFFPSSCMMQNG